jgi:flagellar biosynthesis protein
MTTPAAKRPKYRLAVGLEYEQNREAGKKGGATPLVSLKGEELLADAVVAMAARYGVPIVEEPALSRSLAALDLDQEIPPALFEAVAIILAQVERSVGERHRKGQGRR